MIPESTIWSYVIQLTGALRVIHAAGLACRSLDPSKVVLTARSRLRISGTGIADVLTFDSAAANPLALIPHYQVCILPIDNFYSFILELYSVFFLRVWQV